MKLSRIPIRAFGNQVIQMTNDQRYNRPVLSQGVIENQRQVVRCVSQEQQIPQSSIFICQQRGQTPPVKKSLQETIAYYPKQQQLQTVPLKHDNIKSSIINQELNKVQSQLQLIEGQKDEVSQQIIKQQNEQISQLQQQLSEKVHQYQQIQEKFNNEFKKFQVEIKNKLSNIDLNISLNDFTQQFMVEIDRKVGNLEKNIVDQITEMKNECEQICKQREHLVQNLSSNTQLRINDDEGYFKHQIEILNNKLQQKADRGKVETTIQQQIQQIQNQYQIQLSQAHQLLNKINNDKSDELNQIKNQIQCVLTNLNQTVNYKLQEIFDNINDKEVENKKQEQDYKQIKQQLQTLIQQFQSLQQQSLQTIKQQKIKINMLEDEKKETGKQLKKQSSIVIQLQSDLEKLKTTNSVLTLQQSPQLKQNSFFSNSTAAVQQKSKRQLTVIKKKNEISLDDFADFNENSIFDSNDSFDINETGGFSKNVKESSLVYGFQSPSKNPFKKSQLININKLLNEDLQSQTSNKSRGKSAPIQCQNAIQKAIKRRLLYLGKNEKTLQCTYNSEKHLIDIEMGLCLLDENGNPFIINETEKQNLIQQKLIRIV